MKASRKKLIFWNVGPAILSNACVFLFSVVDGIFVGNGAGSQALGAVNIALPFVLLAQALNAMASIGGVTITAIRFGREDKEGAQNAFMHSFTLNLVVGVFIVRFCVYRYRMQTAGRFGGVFTACKRICILVCAFCHSKCTFIKLTVFL